MLLSISANGKRCEDAEPYLTFLLALNFLGGAISKVSRLIRLGIKALLDLSDGHPILFKVGGDLLPSCLSAGSSFREHILKQCQVHVVYPQRGLSLAHELD